MGGHHSNTRHPDTVYKASLAFALNKEMHQPSRLRAAFEERKRVLSAGKGLGASGRLGQSASSPGLLENSTASTSGHGYFGGPGAEPLPSARVETPHLRPSSSSAASRASTPRDEDAPPLWFPHPSTNRGMLTLTKPAALIWGVDPAKHQTTKCPLWEGSHHRFSAVSNLPEARPRTPTKSMRWKCDDAWNNPDNHPELKVTSTLPRGCSPSLKGTGTMILPPA